MDTEKIVKEARNILFIGIIVGVILLGLGIGFKIMEVSFISNPKAIIGLSLLKW